MKIEIIAGIATFLAMAYILIVNPNNILYNTGVNDPRWSSIFIATSFGAVIGTLLMSFLAKMPLAQAPGLGLNSAIGGLIGGGAGAISGGIMPLPTALLLVFFSGIIFLLLSIIPCGKDQNGNRISLREKMFEKFKANILFNKLLKRPDISKAYAMVPETDSWYATIKKVHESLEKIHQEVHEILEINSKDNLKLKAVYYPNKSTTTVICVHGYTSHAEREWAFPGLFYLSLEYNVLIPYQIAHGISEGKYISFGSLEHMDMIDWVNKVNEINPNGKIIIHGLRMGGGIVLDLSKIKLKNVKCLIADAPSESIKEFFENVSKEVFKDNYSKIVPHIIKRYKKEFGYDVSEYEVVEIVENSQYPILLSAGSNEHCEELFDTIKKVNPYETDIVILPGCNHGNGMYKQTELYQSKIKDFLKKHL